MAPATTTQEVPICKCGAAKEGRNAVKKKTAGGTTIVCRACEKAARKRWRLRQKGFDVVKRRMPVDELITWYQEVYGWDQCWVGHYDQGAGATTTVDGQSEVATRAIYKRFHGVCLLPTTVLDHHAEGGCGDSSCNNPLHVSATDARGNALTGNGVGAINARKQFCHRGHPFTEGNTLRDKWGRRVCLRCTQLKHRDSTDPDQLTLDLEDLRTTIVCVG